MSSDLLIRQLRGAKVPRLPVDPALLPLEQQHREQLAQAYLNAYPPGVAAENLDEALQEIDATFADEYGKLRLDASWVAVQDGAAVGAILVVERSLWDPDLVGPFIVDLFLTPASQGRGIGLSLVEAAINACDCAGDPQISLRIGEGTSAAATHLYAVLGFVPPTEAQ